MPTATARTLITQTLIITFILTATAFAYSVAGAEVLEQVYTFERPRLEPVTINGQVYDRVIMPGAEVLGDAGQPLLPARGTKILLPPGTRIVHVEAEHAAPVLVGTDVLVEPAGECYPLSEGPSVENIPVPDPFIYASNKAYPGEQYADVQTHHFRGFPVAIVKLLPTEYLPAAGELSYFPSITLRITVEETGAHSSLLRGWDTDRDEITAKVDNPEIVERYPRVMARPPAQYDMLIITTSTLTPAFQPLKEYHDTTGILTEIHTLTDIGSSNPDNVRDYIRDQYLNSGISYVLIGADDDIVPAQNLYVSQCPATSTDMPGDIFFACLDGTWNYDGDSRVGEPTDGEDGGDVDLMAEVYVGRASVGNTTEATRFVDKTITFINATGPYLNRVLLCGEHLGFGGLSEYAANSLDELVGGSGAHGYYTYGFPPAKFIVDKLYDRDWAGNDWPLSELKSRIDNGRQVINHFGHGNTSWALKMSSSQTASVLDNAGLCFIYSQACYSGRFDGTDGWAEYATVKNDLGAFAIVMNARYGWGVSGSTDGASQRFNREFWDAVFNPVEYTSQLGRANQGSKEDNIYRINSSCMRWCAYELNLFGDPTVALKFAPDPGSLSFAYPEGVPDTVSPLHETTFPVEIMPMYGGIPVPGSVQLHCTLNGEELLPSPLTDLGDNMFEASLPAIGCQDSLCFYFSAEEIENGVFVDPDPASPYSPVVISDRLIPFADNFQYQLDWTVSGDATDGHWVRGMPGAIDDDGRPSTDYDGSYYCYVTHIGMGDTDVDNGTSYLTSPVFDLSAGNGRVEYARWYSNDLGDDPQNDVFVVSISNDDGTTWTVAETVGPTEESSGGWFEHQFWAGDFVTPTDQMRLRFAVSDLNDDSNVEAAVDAVQVTIFECVDCDCAGFCDLTGDQAIDPLDVSYIVNYVFKQQDARVLLSDYCPYDNGDWDEDGEVTPVDVSYYVNYVFKQFGGAPTDPCTQ